MDRLSRVSLWTLVGAALTASGCADVLGFKDFSDDDGGGGLPNGAATAQNQGNPNGGGTSDPNGGSGSTGTNSGSSGSSTGGVTAAGTGGSTSAGNGSTGAGSGSTGNASTGSTGAGGSAGGGSGGGSSSSGSSARTGTGASSSSATGASSSSSTGAGSSSTGASSSSTGASSSSTTSSGGGGSCTYGTASDGDGSFTFYFFGQGGTTQTSPGNFKTACGYAGTEASGGGLSGQAGSVVDTVPNAADNSPASDTYFAAIPNTSGTTFDTSNFCGACVEITNGGTSVVATIVDECPVADNPKCVSGHLDLSTQVFDALDFTNGDPSNTTWKFVPCPEGTKHIQAVENSAGQYYLQSSVYPIGTVGGQSITTNGFFTINPGTYTVTSPYTTQTITITIPNGGGDTGANFTEPTGCF